MGAFYFLHLMENVVELLAFIDWVELTLYNVLQHTGPRQSRAIRSQLVSTVRSLRGAAADLEAVRSARTRVQCGHLGAYSMSSALR